MASDSVPFESDEILSLSLRRKDRVPWEHAPFLALHAFAVYCCLTTVGMPYVAALAKAERLENDDGSDLNEPCQPLPWEHMPAFSARLYLGGAILLHVLLVLMKRWSVSFHCWLKFPKVFSLETAEYILVVPAAHRGKTTLVQLKRTKLGKPYFDFQKFKFIFEEAVSVTGERKPRAFRKASAPLDLPLGEYLSSVGHSAASARSALERYGLNVFKMEMPSFWDMYQERLMSPFSVFQIFCVLLWCLDEYWLYSVFTLLMVFVFEGTTVVSRIESVRSLQGMNNKPRDVLTFRGGVWRALKAEQLVPGDLVSLSRETGPDSDIIPCDCLLIRGNAVVNEATLTGESVPQMKEGIPLDEATRLHPLDMQGAHKVNILYGGTSMLQHAGPATDPLATSKKNDVLFADHEESEAVPDAPPSSAPDGGCICYVICTGFDSSQGKLVRMIEHSSENVSGDTKEMALLLLFLLSFALVASGYVLKRGLEEERDQFDLLLRCILILTSVVPPDLNMQLALAINSSVMILRKMNVVCTEPFRIPLAGKVDSTMFDKTGTITTDELVPMGIVVPSCSKAVSTDADLVAMVKAPKEIGLVLAGCHSLMNIKGKASGDPLEVAAFQAVRWRIDDTDGALFPPPGVEAHPDWIRSSEPKLKVLHRYHFASKLQRMSTVVKLHTSTEKPVHMVLVKGSAEMIASLLDRTAPNQPSEEWYTATHSALAARGMRVIALAYKKVKADDPRLNRLQEEPRTWAESDLVFAGFAAFSCLVRKDSAQVVKALQESSHTVAMITGDAILTAIHVASAVNISSSDRSKILVLAERNDDLVWEQVDTHEVIQPFEPEGITEMGKTYDLCVTGKTLAAATAKSAITWDHVRAIKVFARMTPDSKETILVKLNQQQHFTLMCGDGANDVGALKQAHVGVALLTGFGSINVDKPETVVASEAKPNVAVAPRKTQEQIQKELQEEFQRDAAERRARGEWFAEFKAMGAAVQKAAAVKKEEVARQQQLAAAGLLPTATTASAGAGSATTGANAAAAANKPKNPMEGLDTMQMPMLKLGDASIASPFTSKRPSIVSAVDIIRQGRCTLVTALQMYQILALNCLISSFSLSVLHLDGVKFGDRQYTAKGLLGTISFLSISWAKPLEKLSPARPITSIFHPAMFLSLMGQFAIHLLCTLYVVQMTKPHLGSDHVVSVDGHFKANLINSVVFLVSSIQQVAIFVVNYKGPPFMSGITQNRFLMWSLNLCGIGVVVIATNTFPTFNKWFQLVEYPHEEFQQEFLLVLFFNFVAVILWDRLMLMLFARDIFGAMLSSITKKDVFIVVRNVILGLLFVTLFLSGDFPEEDEELLAAAAAAAVSGTSNATLPKNVAAA
eukprot:m.197814 g.197814  ORF g.197814 m.197814 type:complete len:1363 (+) comp17670_c0_seq2:1993-6081(+)